MTALLILLRHGQSTYNAEHRFTGWIDSDLTSQGRAEAVRSGRDLAAAGMAPDVVHTSLQVRAIRTANLALDELDRLWIPVRRDWRLNERHYGALQGLDKRETAAEHGAEAVFAWRRGYDTRPPRLHPDDERHPRHDPRYSHVDPAELPTGECLKDVSERLLPYWNTGIVPDLVDGASVLIAAHGNSLRALVKHLDGISDHDIVELNLPTGVPIAYELGADHLPTDRRPITDRFLGDTDAARAAADEVAREVD